MSATPPAAAPGAWIVLLLAVVAVAAACSREAAPSRPPNIVILLADDLGWRDVGYHGGEISTPNIDRLASEGVRLERFYTAPMCSPTRAGLLTGRYPLRFGMMRSVITPWSTYGMPESERTLAEMLGEAGYTRRAAVGKWHLGHASREYHPLNQGFTHFYGQFNGAIGYFSHLCLGQRDWHRDFEPSPDEGYTTDLIAQEAVRQIEAASVGEPFFLYVAFNAPHRPYSAKPEDKKRYPDRRGVRRTYAAMVDSLDQAVGRILDALDAKGVAEGTLVLFASDNGGDGPGDNRPLRGGKSMVYEGAIRVPAIVRWPEGIRGHREVDAVTGYIDVYPTLERVAGLDAPDPNPLDGRDMLDVYRGEAKALPREWFTLFGRSEHEQAAIMRRPWKLVVRWQGALGTGADALSRAELYDVWEDPSEEHDLSSSHPDIVADLLERLREINTLQVPGVGTFHEGQDGFRPPPSWEIGDGRPDSARPRGLSAPVGP